MSLKKGPWKGAAVGLSLEIGVLAGVSMSPEQIESLMEVMNRVKIVHVIHKEREDE